MKDYTEIFYDKHDLRRKWYGCRWRDSPVRNPERTNQNKENGK
jgi:hypothetical protein